MMCPNLRRCCRADLLACHVQRCARRVWTSCFCFGVFDRFKPYVKPVGTGSASLMSVSVQVVGYLLHASGMSATPLDTDSD